MDWWKSGEADGSEESQPDSSPHCSYRIITFLFALGLRLQEVHPARWSLSHFPVAYL